VNFIARKVFQLNPVLYKISSALGARLCRPGGNPGANLKSISHRCCLFEVAFVWKLTKETIHLPLGCLQGGVQTLSALIARYFRRRGESCAIVSTHTSWGQEEARTCCCLRVAAAEDALPAAESMRLENSSTASSAADAPLPTPPQTLAPTVQARILLTTRLLSSLAPSIWHLPDRTPFTQACTDPSDVGKAKPAEEARSRTKLSTRMH